MTASADAGCEKQNHIDGLADDFDRGEIDEARRFRHKIPGLSNVSAAITPEMTRSESPRDSTRKWRLSCRTSSVSLPPSSCLPLERRRWRRRGDRSRRPPIPTISASTCAPSRISASRTARQSASATASARPLPTTSRRSGAFSSPTITRSTPFPAPSPVASSPVRASRTSGSRPISPSFRHRRLMTRAPMPTPCASAPPPRPASMSMF